jgi:hypothetical protein
MAQTLKFNELETASESIFDPEVLKEFITETIMQSNEEWVSLMTSFSYIAIQRFIAHCKNHSLDPLEMKFEEIQKFSETCLQKELKQEMKHFNIG